MAGLVIFFVVRPLLTTAAGGGGGGLMPMLSGPSGGGSHDMGASNAGGASPQQALRGPDQESRIDIAKIEGQVKASSVKRVAEFVEAHPEESVSILRAWLHESA
jgi:flagellar M-ring protein FliF